jgi:hypothetical protein
MLQATEKDLEKIIARVEAWASNAKSDGIAAETALDRIYVIRTSMTA